MIILITGASHTGKTLLAQQMLEGEKVIMIESDFEKAAFTYCDIIYLLSGDERPAFMNFIR